ncbi:uncharacterized protein [Spinacia oleracea]|uniref:Bifunctional inhibitor/plant lipid transfer protein/seed storage helical domain-containing protein n=1 Tax=Spinacia oleracea TaxID=3562 RepID=A0ABM3R039_SPIOL|nr:uncharacterized protein LOC110784910 [Spinacia oleracea]
MQRPTVAQCCPAISSARIFETACFCSAKADILSQHAQVFFDNVLAFCGIPATLETICPAQQAAPCWANIAPCLEAAKVQNYATAAVEMCCPAISNIMINDSSCFCLAKTDVVSQHAQPIFNDILTTCKITGTTLDALCPDTPSSPSSTTPPTPNTTPSTPGTPP